MAHKFNAANNPFVVLDDDGYMMMYSKDGHEIGSNIFLRVQDHADQTPFVIGKFSINIVSSKDEMFKEIERFKK